MLDDRELRKRLTPLQYHVTREKGTEQAFTGKYWNCDEKGHYRCICCHEALFDSSAKFDSGCGWPSFSAATSGQCVNLTEDTSHRLLRTEVTCSKCGAHLGHVFPDGPGPTGDRYCINSASIDLETHL